MSVSTGCSSQYYEYSDVDGSSVSNMEEDTMLGSIVAGSLIRRSHLALVILDFLHPEDLLNACTASKNLNRIVSPLCLKKCCSSSMTTGSYDRWRQSRDLEWVPSAAQEEMQMEEIEVILPALVLQSHSHTFRVTCSFISPYSASILARIYLLDEEGNIAATHELRTFSDQSPFAFSAAIDVRPTSRRYTLTCTVEHDRATSKSDILEQGLFDNIMLESIHMESLIYGTDLVHLYRSIAYGMNVDWDLIMSILDDESLPMYLKEEALQYSSHSCNDDCDFTRYSYDGDSLLHLAYRDEVTTEIFRLVAIIGGKYATSARDCRGCVPLHYAANRDNIEEMELLLEIGGDVNAITYTDYKGRNPLHYASGNAYVEAIMFLVSVGGEYIVLGRDDSGLTPLHYASENGNTDAMKILIETGGINAIVAENEDNRTPLHFAAEQGNIEAMKLLIDTGGDEIVLAQDKDNHTPLHFAVETCNYASMKILVKAGGSDVVLKKNNSGSTALHQAIKICVVEVRALEQRYITSPPESSRQWWGNEDEQSDAIDSVEEEDETHVTYLLKLLAGCEAMQPLNLLVKTGGKDAVLEGDNDMRTPLHYAAMTGYADAIETLLDLGEKEAALAKDVFGFIPLHLACEQGHVEAIKILIDAGGEDSVTFVDHDAGCIPLHLAADHGHKGAMELLVDVGGKDTVMIKDRIGRTPLHYMAENRGDKTIGYIEAMMFLVDTGGRDAIMAKDDNGKTPLDYAQDFSHISAKEMLTYASKSKVRMWLEQWKSTNTSSE